MDFLNLLNDIQQKNDQEVQQLADSYGVFLTTDEISLLRPLVNDISIHWYFTGIPTSFLHKVEQIVGSDKMQELLNMYYAALNRQSP